MSNRRLNNHYSRAFTIMELLVVIVVIGILAAIVIVSYNGITDRSSKATLETDLRNAASKLETYKAENGSYPSATSVVDDGKGLPASPGVTYQYSYDSVMEAFCLTGTSNNLRVSAYHITNSHDAPQEGACVGHS